MEKEEDKKIIHLFMTDKCTHHCPMCCNKQYSIDEIPVVTVEELKNAEMVLLTGGEPFLIDGVCDLAKEIKSQYRNVKYVYVYTCGDSLYGWLSRHDELHDIDGVNISPKNRYDLDCVVDLFKKDYLRQEMMKLSSNRLYLFPEQRKQLCVSILGITGYENVEIIYREWQETFKAQSGIFRRLPVLLQP